MFLSRKTPTTRQSMKSYEKIAGWGGGTAGGHLTHPHLFTYSLRINSYSCSLYEELMEIPQKTKNMLPYDSAIPYILGIYSEKTIIWKDTCTPMFITVLFYNSQDVEAT